MAQGLLDAPLEAGHDTVEWDSTSWTTSAFSTDRLAFGIPLRLLQEPCGELPDMRLCGAVLGFDDEIRPRPDDGLAERCRQRARLKQVVDQRLPAECHPLPADRGLDHL